MSNQIEGAEVFDAGTWNGMRFDEGDLDGIADSFNALNLSGRVPLKFGHKGKDTRFDDGQPALGWVKKVYRRGSKLVADFTDVPTEVYDAIKKGLYKFVSVELLRNVPAGTRKIPWVLDAVALLGATAPAVGTLKDLQSLTYARDTGLRYEEAIEFSREEHRSIHNGERVVMADESNPVRELTERLEKLTLENSRLQEENRGLKQVKAQFSQLEQRFTDLTENVEKKERDGHRARIKERFERAIKGEEIVPAVRERFMKTYRVEDDEYVMTIDMKDVEEFIRENPNPKPKRKPATVFSLQDPTGDVPAGTPPDQELLMRAQASLARKGVHKFTADDLQTEAVSIMKQNGELANNWKYQPDEFYASLNSR